MMIRTAVLALLLFPAAQDEDKTETFQLDNGLRVYLRHVKHHDAVMTAIGYRAGTLDDPEGKAGLAALTKTMVYQAATTSFPAYEIEKRFLDDGFFNKQFMDSNAEIFHDYSYFCSLQPVKNFELQLQVEAERMRSAKLDGALLNKERPKVLNEIKSFQRNPNALPYFQILNMTFSKSNYRHFFAGTTESVEKLTLKDVHEFYDAHYRPDEAALVIYGKIPGNARELIQKHFGGIKKPEKAPPTPVSDPHEGKGSTDTLWSGKRIPTQVLISFRSARPRTTEKAALIIAVAELRDRLNKDGRVGGHTAHRIIRDDFTVRGRFMTLFAFTLDGSSRPEPVADGALDVISKLAESPPDRRTLEKHVAALRRELTANDTLQLRFYKRDRERYHQTLGLVAIARVRHQIAGADVVEDFLKKLDSLTPEDVKAAAAKFLTRERANVLTVRPR